MTSQERIMWAAGDTSRVILARILPGEDLIEGLEAACREAGVRQGIILCCFGSLRESTLRWVTPNSEVKLGAAYTEPCVVAGPIEFLSAQGTIVPIGPDEMFTHMHGTVADRDGRVWGGHLVKGGNPVLATMEVAIGEIVGIRLARAHDEEVDLPEIVITPQVTQSYHRRE
jgi:predicted DNA-binding protein with PD1-like motif